MINEDVTLNSDDVEEENKSSFFKTEFGLKLFSYLVKREKNNSIFMLIGAPLFFLSTCFFFSTTLINDKGIIALSFLLFFVSLIGFFLGLLYLDNLQGSVPVDEDFIRKEEKNHSASSIALASIIVNRMTRLGGAHGAGTRKGGKGSGIVLVLLIFFSIFFDLEASSGRKALVERICDEFSNENADPSLIRNGKINSRIIFVAFILRAICILAFFIGTPIIFSIFGFEKESAIKVLIFIVADGMAIYLVSLICSIMYVKFIQNSNKEIVRLSTLE